MNIRYELSNSRKNVKFFAEGDAPKIMCIIIHKLPGEDDMCDVAPLSKYQSEVLGG
jgi:hypothetical protein